jgi:hypothetical protein
MDGGHEDTFLAPQISIGSKDPHALKIPARRAESKLTESALSPFQAEPTQNDDGQSKRFNGDFKTN